MQHIENHDDIGVFYADIVRYNMYILSVRFTQKCTQLHK